MLLDRNFYLRILAVAVMAGGLFGVAMGSRVRAAPLKGPLQQVASSDTPTPTETFTSSPSDTQTDTPTPTDTPTDTPTLTLTQGLSDTPTDTPTVSASPTISPTSTNSLPSPTRTPSAPDHLVISEFRTTGPLGGDDEFVEIYNPTGAPVYIGYWTISKSSGCGTSITVLVTIYYGTVLQPGQHYLVAAYASYSSISNADQRFSPGIADNGGVALVNSSGTVIDQVGMCDGTYYHEGRTLPPLPVAPLAGTPTPLPGTSFQSYERKPGGNTSCYDTNDNLSDFNLISPANPQNQANGAVLCAGVVLSTLTRTPTITITPTRTPTRVPTAVPAVAVLNEFLPRPQTDWNGDGVANVGDEYIEIINLGSTSLSVTGWKLDTGLNSKKTFTIPNLTLQPRQIVAFFGTQTGLSLSDGGATVRLLKSSGQIVDAYTYPAVELPDRTYCRLPDGTDIWGFVCHPTPGRPNMSIISAVPGSTPAAGGNSNCPQASSAPPSLVMAECNGFGSGISNNLEDGLYWLQTRLKWDVFIE